MWGIPSGATEPQLLGATELDMIADSINISNIRAGYGDGVFFPEDCLAPCN